MNSTLLSKFKCQRCSALSDDNQVFQCVNKHLLCMTCHGRSASKCQCGATFSRITNPLLSFIPVTECKTFSTSSKLVCPFDGCKWIFTTTNDIQSHSLECKYRPYSCIGTKLRIWGCNWMGKQSDLAEHIKTAHPTLGDFYKYWQEGSVEYLRQRSISTMNIIDAFNKKFVFYYCSQQTSSVVVFLIFLVGRREDSQKYLVDFELKQKHRKIKFIEKVYCDADNLNELIEKKEHCIAIPKSIIESYLVDNRCVHFRFILKRKDAFDEEESTQVDFMKNKLHSSEIEFGGRQSKSVTSGVSTGMNTALENSTTLNYGKSQKKPFFNRRGV